MIFFRLVGSGTTPRHLLKASTKKTQAEFQKVTIFIFIFWPTDWTMLNKKQKKWNWKGACFFSVRNFDIHFYWLKIPILWDFGTTWQVLTFWKAKFWESAHPALNEWAADGSYDSGSFIADAAEGFVFDGGLHWLRPLRMFLGKASTCQFLFCFFPVWFSCLWICGYGNVHGENRD